jgi:hypothetical protein
MLIKNADDKSRDIEYLEEALSRKGLKQTVKRNIEQELARMKAGIKGEKEAAYELAFSFGRSDDWVILHDLRIEFGDRVAQMDHLLINRNLEIFVCESKHFSQGVTVNAQGEFSTRFKGQTKGIPSPIEQNKKHLAVLQDMLLAEVSAVAEDGAPLIPRLFSYIMVSKQAAISRPKGVEVPGLEQVVKSDQLVTRIQSQEQDSTRKCSRAEMLRFAEVLLSKHRPIQFNWDAKFGLGVEAELSPSPHATLGRPRKARGRRSGGMAFVALAVLAVGGFTMLNVFSNMMNGIQRDSQQQQKNHSQAQKALSFSSTLERYGLALVPDNTCQFWQTNQLKAGAQVESLIDEGAAQGCVLARDATFGASTAAFNAHWGGYVQAWNNRLVATPACAPYAQLSVQVFNSQQPFAKQLNSMQLLFADARAKGCLKPS